MGMFDDITVKVPLPGGSTTTNFQTKSLVQMLDDYEIREDGTLWHEEYDIEDHSDPTKEGIMRLAGIATRVNKRWVQVTDFTGEITFHTLAQGPRRDGGILHILGRRAAQGRSNPIA